MRCSGCLGEFADDNDHGPTHPYMLSSPACWAAYGRLLASEYQDPTRMRLRRLTVDTYAIQHPGVDTPAARRSVGIHLSRIFLILECGLPMEYANAAMITLARRKDDFEWLQPPSMQGTITVGDVLIPYAAAAAEHDQLVLDWARSVWKAWQVHHTRVREWTAIL
jgi:hypothetical protein